MTKLTTSCANTFAKIKLPTGRALLSLLGQRCQDDQILAPLHALVKIKQKTVRHTPTQKLQDCLLAILCGVEAVYQLNTTVVADPAVSRAWGRESCADQSSIQATLSATDWQNLNQMRQALAQIFQKHSRTARHNPGDGPLILDLDMTGLPCSKQAEGASAGYFASCKKGTTGRQLARISAAAYNEIVYEQIFPGNTACQNLAAFKQMLAGLELVLGSLSLAKSQILIRLDGGYGTSSIVNLLLEEGYQFVVKLYSGVRARKLGQALPEQAWCAAGADGREAAQLATADGTFYQSPLAGRQLYQLAVRCKVTARTKSSLPSEAKTDRRVSSGYRYSVLLVSRQALDGAIALELSPESLAEQLAFYDERACIESASFRGDKQGLKLVKRRKQSLCGQEMLILLAQLAHNLLSWLKGWLSAEQPKLARFGTQRLVRDLLPLPGRLTFRAGRIVKVRLASGHRLAIRYAPALTVLAHQSGIRLILDKT